jgi:protocatechuate 3,4-dioxygenase beta subunit
MNPTRREMIRAVLGFGGIAAVQPIVRTWAASLTETPIQTRGPFYPVSRPLDADADLTLIQGRSERARGRIVHLMGRVLDSKGRPVRGAKIELWQANANGRYAHPADVNPAPLDPNFQGFGVQTTDDEGQYRFRTIKPAAYPVNPKNPRAVRPPHIHFDVTGRDSRLVTQMYFPGEPTNESDVIFGQLAAEERRAATAKLLPVTADVEPDALIAHWDIVLVGR